MGNNIKVATIISYITLIVGNFISILYTPFMLTQLGSSEYGLFSLVNTIISYIYLLDMGLGNAIIRYNAKYMAENDEKSAQKINGMFFVLYSIISLIGIIIGIIIYKNLGTLFASGLSNREVDSIKIMFIIALINLAASFPLNVFSGIIMAHEKFVFIKITNLIKTALNPIIMIAILLLGYKSLGMLIASTIFNIVMGIINIIYCFYVLKIKMIFTEFDKSLYKEIFKYSFYIFLSAIAYRIYWSTDQVVLGMFVSSSSIAIYSIGIQFNSYFVSFSNVISSMFLPKLTKMSKTENKNELMKLLIKVSRIQAFIAIFIILGFILIGKQFIMIWAGSEYEMSYYIALLIMIPQIISIIQTLFSTMLEAMNKHQMKAFIYLGVSILNLIITLILVKRLGVIGCALGTTIGMIINSILNNIYYKYKLKLNMLYYWKEILKLSLPMSLTFAIGYILVKFINTSSYLGICAFIILFTIIFVVICWSIALNDDEKQIVLSCTNRIFNRKNREEVI